MSKARPYDEDDDTEHAHLMSDEPMTPEYKPGEASQSSRRASRESSMEREPVPPDSYRTTRTAAKRQKGGEFDPAPFMEAFDAIGMAGLEAAPSDSAAVHLLIAFRTHVDALKTFGVFDDYDDTHLDEQLALLGFGVDTKGFYKVVSGFINEHIAYERKKETPVDMDEYMKQAAAPKARPYALFDVETMIPESKPEEKQRLAELLKKQNELELEVVIATGFAEVSVLDKAVDAAETESEFLSAVPSTLKAHSKLLAPFHAASLENIQELANTVLRANPVNATPGSFDFNTVYDSRYNALVERKRTTRRNLAKLPAFTLASTPSSVPELAPSNREVSSADTSDWRSLFPSCTTGAPSYPDRQDEFQRLQELYGGVGQNNIPVYRQALDIMPDDILADVNIDSGQAFKRSLVSVVKYAAAWANGHKLQALVYLAPYLALALGFGGAATLATVAVVDLFRLAKRKVDQAGGWQEVQRLRQGFTSLSRPVRSIAGLLGGVGFSAAITYVIDSPLVSEVYNEWTMLNNAVMRAANMDQISWFTTMGEVWSRVSDTNVNPGAIVQQVQQWRMALGVNSYSAAELGAGTLNRGPAEGMESYAVEWGRTGRNIRNVTDVVWKFLQTYPTLGAVPVLATREIINLVCIHQLEIRPDRARVYLYEADPENPDYAKTLDQLKTALSAAKIQFEYDRGNQPCAADWVPQNPPAGANLPDWYKTVHALTNAPPPAAQVVPTLKDWAEHTKAMFDKAEKKWTVEYNRSWTDDSTEKLVETAQTVYHCRAVVQLIEGSPYVREELVVAPSNVISDNLILRLKTLVEHDEEWKTLSNTFNNFAGREFRHRTNAAAETSAKAGWMAIDAGDVPAGNKVSQYWWMLQQLLEYQIDRIHGSTLLDPALAGVVVQANTDVLDAAALEELIGYMEIIFAGAKAQSTKVSRAQNDLGFLQVPLAAFPVVQPPAPPAPAQVYADQSRATLEALFDSYYLGTIAVGRQFAFPPGAALPAVPALLPPPPPGGAAGGAGVPINASVVDEVFARLHRLRLS
jgi:hypothetical protein